MLAGHRRNICKKASTFLATKAQRIDMNYKNFTKREESIAEKL